MVFAFRQKHILHFNILLSFVKVVWQQRSYVFFGAWLRLRTFLLLKKEEKHMQNFYIACQVIGIIGTIVSTIACPIIADRKGRSIGGWIVGGFLLGWLGLIIIGCLSDNTPMPKPPTSDFLKKPPDQIKQAARYCPHCGKYISEYTIEHLCPFCGKIIK